MEHVRASRPGGAEPAGRSRGNPVSGQPVALAVLLLLGSVAAARGAYHGTIQVSLGLSGAATEGASTMPSISADGRLVAFSSRATNLISGDGNGAEDVFVRDLAAGTAERVNVASDGSQANAASHCAGISADGRFVAFFSYASNLLPSDPDGSLDVFLRDRLLRTTELISAAPDGTSGEGQTAGLVLGSPQVSADGRFVAFYSTATDLVVPDKNGAREDVFVRDRLLGRTERISVNSQGVQANHISAEPAMSADGRFVAFTSLATNLVSNDANGTADVFVRDRLLGTTTLVSYSPRSGAPADGYSGSPAITADGRFVAFHSDAGNLVEAAFGGPHVYLRDLQQQTTELISLSSVGATGNGAHIFPALSADGRFVAFASDSTNLALGFNAGDRPAYLFVRDRLLGETERLSQIAEVSPPNSPIESRPGISGDGRFVAFESRARRPGSTDLDGTDPDIFVDVRSPPADNLPPVADSGPDVETAIPHDGNPATDTAVPVLDGRFSYDPDGSLYHPAGALFYEWLGPGNPVPLGTSALFSPSLTAGKHTFLLRVMDVFGAKSQARVSVRVLPEPNRPPQADAGPDQAVPEGSAETVSVTLNGGGSLDPDGDGLSYAWSEDGASLATGPTPTVSLEPGRHRIVLTVTDPYGASSTDVMTVTVGVAEVTREVVIRRGRLVPKSGRNRYEVRLRITNRSDGSLPAPVSVVFDGLAGSGPKVRNKTGDTTEATGFAGRPYLDVLTSGVLAPGQSVEAVVLLESRRRPAVLPGSQRVFCGVGPR